MFGDFSGQSLKSAFIYPVVLRGDRRADQSAKQVSCYALKLSLDLDHNGSHGCKLEQQHYVGFSHQQAQQDSHAVFIITCMFKCLSTEQVAALAWILLFWVRIKHLLWLQVSL